jgi:Spy/CpxP family protein refolding chaperone
MLIALCTGISLLTVHLMHDSLGDGRHDSPRGHEWLEQELGLSRVELQAINQFVPEYHSERQKLELDFDQRITELGQILAANENYTDAVTHAVHRIHEIHGQLQELSIRHYFDMLRVLPPEKQQGLRDLASEALSRPR